MESIGNACVSCGVVPMLELKSVKPGLVYMVAASPIPDDQGRPKVSLGHSGHTIAPPIGQTLVVVSVPRWS